MKLRPYQLDAMDGVDGMLVKHKSTLLEMATGLGKTVVFSYIADAWPGRVLVIAHRDELIRQAAEKIYQITGKPCAIEMGRESASNELYGTKVTVASVQTLSRATRRSRFHPDHFSLLIVDEGHHAVALSYRGVLDYFAIAKKLFVTATPKRGDKIGLGAVCESVAFQYGIEPAINDGWLVPVKQQVVQVEGLDFSRVRTVASDLNQGDLDEILTEEKPLHSMCASAHEIIGNRQALWFCNSVEHARKTSGVLSRYVGDSVKFLSGDTPVEDRRDVVRHFKQNKIQHLVNCGLFLEGFDAPNTAAVVMGRPTKSLSLYMQVLGRGTRPLPGIVDGVETPEGRKEAIAQSDKPNMVVIDFAGNAGRHKIIQAADVLGGRHPEAVREYAKKTMADEGRAVDIEDALERSKMELELWEEEEDRRKHVKAQASYQTYEVDPFIRQYARGQPAAGDDREMCTEKQAKYICYLSGRGGPWTFEKAMGLTKRSASGVISRLRKESA